MQTIEWSAEYRNTGQRLCGTRVLASELSRDSHCSLRLCEVSVLKSGTAIAVWRVLLILSKRVDRRKIGK